MGYYLDFARTDARYDARDPRNLQIGNQAVATVEEAREIAAAMAGDGTLVSADITDDEGKPVEEIVPDRGEQRVLVIGGIAVAAVAAALGGSLRRDSIGIEAVPEPTGMLRQMAPIRDAGRPRQTKADWRRAMKGRR